MAAMSIKSPLIPKCFMLKQSCPHYNLKSSENLAHGMFKGWVEECVVHDSWL